MSKKWNDWECTWARTHRWALDQPNCAGSATTSNGDNYCALHCPKKRKKVAFRDALREKLKEANYDLKGAWFPEYITLGNFLALDPDHIQREEERRECRKDVNCAFATFSEGVNLSNIDFHSDIDFSESVIEVKAIFRDSVFVKQACFSGTRFQPQEGSSSAESTEVDFWGTRFNDEANFSGSKFTVDEADFSNASFQSGADFSEASFDKGVKFANTTFSGTIRFVGNRDNKVFDPTAQVEFHHAQIDNPEQFTFHTLNLRAQWLTNAQGIRTINFANVEWYGWPVEEGKTLKCELQKPNSQDPTATEYRLIANTCRELAINYEEGRQYAEAGKFYYGSQNAQLKSQRRLRVPFTLAFWYWALSGYSERPRRAFGWVAALLVGFALLYTITDLPGKGADQQCVPLLLGREQSGENGSGSYDHSLNGCTQEIGRAAVYSFGGMTRQVQEPKPQTDPLRSLVTLEGTLGPLTIALLALAIRRKFLR